MINDRVLFSPWIQQTYPHVLLHLVGRNGLSGQRRYELLVRGFLRSLGLLGIVLTDLDISWRGKKYKAQN